MCAAYLQSAVDSIVVLDEYQRPIGIVGCYNILSHFQRNPTIESQYETKIEQIMFEDFLPGYTFGYGDIMSLIGPFVIRTFDMGKGRAAKDRDLATGSPVLAVLGTKSDEPLDWIIVGMALARMLLLARSHNI